MKVRSTWLMPKEIKLQEQYSKNETNKIYYSINLEGKPSNHLHIVVYPNNKIVQHKKTF